MAVELAMDDNTIIIRRHEEDPAEGDAKNENMLVKKQAGIFNVIDRSKGRYRLWDVARARVVAEVDILLFLTGGLAVGLLLFLVSEQISECIAGNEQ